MQKYTNAVKKDMYGYLVASYVRTWIANGFEHFPDPAKITSSRCSYEADSVEVGKEGDRVNISCVFHKARNQLCWKSKPDHL